MISITTFAFMSTWTIIGALSFASLADSICNSIVLSNKKWQKPTILLLLFGPAGWLFLIMIFSFITGVKIGELSEKYFNVRKWLET